MSFFLLILMTSLTTSKFIDCGKYFEFEVLPNLSESQKIYLKCGYYWAKDLLSYKLIGEKYEILPNLYRYSAQQKYKGVPIYGAVVVIEEEHININGEIQINSKPIYGNFYDINHISKYIISDRALLTKQQILDIIFNRYKIDIHLVIADGINGIDIQLFIYPKSLQPHKVYIVKFMYFNSDCDKPYKVHVIIDSDNGEIEQYNFESFSVAVGPGGNPKVGLIELQELRINAIPTISNDNILLYNGKHFGYTEIRQNPRFAVALTCNPSTTDCIVNDEEINYAPCVGCDVFTNINIIYELYSFWLNEESPTSNQQIKAYFHIGLKQNGAWYSSDGSIWISDGDDGRYPYSVLDVLAHEIAHGYTHKYSDLLYEAESGAINEAYSDLVSVAVKSYKAIQGLALWTVGYGTFREPGKAIRFMYDPPKDGVSVDDYKGSDYYDGMDVHYASGIYNKAFYLLHVHCEMSVQMIFKIVSMANNKYWNEYTSFNEGVCAIYEALFDLFGDTPLIEEQCKCLVEQFKSVGVECVIIPDVVNIDEIESITIRNESDQFKSVEPISGLSKSLKLFSLTMDNQHINNYNDINKASKYLIIAMNGTADADDVGDADLYVFADFNHDNYFCHNNKNEQCVIDLNELQFIGSQIFIAIYGFINYGNVSITIVPKIIDIKDIMINDALIINQGIAHQKLKYKFDISAFTSQTYVNIQLFSISDSDHIHDSKANSIILYVYDENETKICQSLLSKVMRASCFSLLPAGNKNLNIGNWYIVIDPKKDFRSLTLLVEIKEEINNKHLRLDLLIILFIVFIIIIKVVCDNDGCQLCSNSKQYIYGQNKHLINYIPHN